MALPEFAFDGNWVDIGSLVTGVLYMGYKYVRDPALTKFFCQKSGSNFANGIALFPLALMILSVLSSAMAKGLLESSKISLAVAGGFALCAILDDR